MGRAEHRELLEALRLREVPHWTTLQKPLARLLEGLLPWALEQAAGRWLPPGPACAAAPVTAAPRTSRAMPIAV